MPAATMPCWVLVELARRHPTHLREDDINATPNAEDYLFNIGKVIGQPLRVVLRTNRAAPRQSLCTVSAWQLLPMYFYFASQFYEVRRVRPAELPFLYPMAIQRHQQVNVLYSVFLE